MGKKNDRRYKISLWTQFPNRIIRQSMVKSEQFKNVPSLEPGGANQSDDLDEDNGGENSSASEDEASVFTRQSYEEAPMITNSIGYIFYVLMRN